MFTAANTTRPGCQRKCGDLTIPYPFGIGPNCSLDRGWLTVICNTSYNPPRAFPMIGLGFSENPEILNITEHQIMIRNSQIASKCYDLQGNEVSGNQGNFDIYDSPFTYATTNRLTVVGCNDYALISASAGTLSTGNQFNFRAGCLALCSNPDEVIQGSCSGLGCCQTSFPVGLQSFTVTLSSLQNRTIGGVSAVQPCGYAFFAGEDSFRFHGASDLSGTVVNRTIQQVPLVLDWSVGVTPSTRLTCDQAKRNSTTYYCQSNTECIDSDAGGYRCNCLSGYEGNPYLEPGCTDVDECAAGSNSPCAMACRNTPGSYQCYCPSGYVGDGLKNGTGGCMRISDNSSSTLKKIILGLGISLGSMLLLFGVWSLYFFIQRRKIVKQKARYFERNGGLLLQQQMSSDESVVARMKIFTSEELERATDNFNIDRILGQGGQGTVYKGMLSEGRIVAIKKSKLVDESQLNEFINEVVILSQINHRNIVKLLGCCLETEVPLLVYEFILNGTLFHHIHHPSEEFPITWRMRLQIASDSAGALAYLHSSSSTPILHRDIKSSNILLDDKYRAKVSDFGTSRSIALDQTHVTTRVVGTFGYLDPEYFQTSQFTEKSDVYSFGVVLVELLTGQKAVRAAFEEERSLTSWFLSHMETSRLLDIIDNQLLQEGSEKEFLRIANLAKRCLNLDGKTRPAMKEVLIDIEAVLSLHLPQQNWPETNKVLTGAPRNVSDDFSTTIYLENVSASSAELSLLFNPR
ncbi:wall-associated receptor kinase-like 8 isoform X2 [Beta vulgaris subsp. vulgaris]|nr:wall-associated receptor kinase-like 8 isoform X2 [Beta vulgaris subsp. vulgaris]